MPIEDEIKFDQDIFKTDDDDGVFTDYDRVEYDSWEQIWNSHNYFVNLQK